MVAEAVTRGELSARQAEAIAGAAAADPGAQSRLVEKAKDGSLRELQDECRRTRANAETDPDAAARRAHATRSCRTWTDADGITGHLHLTGPVAEMARVDNAIRHRADQTFRQARAQGRREPAEAYAFDAAIELLTPPVTATAAPVGADAKIIVRVDHTALVRGRTVEGETCEIAGVGPIPVGTVREWLDDAFIAVVLTKGEDVQKVVHLGPAVHRHPAHRPAMARPRSVPARAAPTASAWSTTTSRTGPTTHTTTVTAAKRFCHPCHQLKSAGWRVSEPDANGQCTFTPPDLTRGGRRRRHRRAGPTPPPPSHRTRTPTRRHRVAVSARR